MQKERKINQTYTAKQRFNNDMRLRRKRYDTCIQNIKDTLIEIVITITSSILNHLHLLFHKIQGMVFFSYSPQRVDLNLKIHSIFFISQ